MIKGLFSAAKRFEGTLTGFRDGRLELRSPVSHGVNQSVRWEEFRIHLVAARVLADGMTIEYEAVFREDAEGQSARLAARCRTPGPGRSAAEMRNAPRLTRVFRVRSQALANFRATTRDVSETGLCVGCEGPLERGSEVELVLDLDTVNAPSLTCRAEVVWCRPDDRAWLVGFRFTNLSPHGVQVLRGFLEQVRMLAEDPHGDLERPSR